MKEFLIRLLRTAVSYIPSKSLMTLRRLKDLPLRLSGRPHEVDFEPLRGFPGNRLTVVDVGANRGQSIESFRSVLQAPNIIAIEPNPMLASSLSKRYPDVAVHAVGLGAESGTFLLHLPRYGHTYWDTRASLDRQYAADFLGPDSFAFYDAERSGIESFEVPIRRLDDFEFEPDILKIDAEGLEADILRGSPDTLAHLPIVILEGPDDEATDYLVDRGYQPYHSAQQKLVAGRGGLNTYFLHPDRHKAFSNTVVERT